MQPAGALSGQPRADEHSTDYFEDSLNRAPRGPTGGFDPRDKVTENVLSISHYCISSLYSECCGP